MCRQPRHAGVAQPLAVSVAEAADVPAQKGAEGRPLGDGGQITCAGRLVDEPRADRDTGGLRGARVLLVGLGDGHAGGQAEVEKVQVGVALPAALEQFDGAPVGAQPVCHPGGQVEGLRAAARGGPVAPAVGLPAGEPVRRGDGRVARGVRQSRQQVLGAGLGQQREPAAFPVRVPAALAEALREEAEEPGPHGRVPPGERDERGAVGRPERGGGADDSRRADQVGHQVVLGGLTVQPGGLDQRAHVLRQRRVRRHAGRAALDQQTAVLRPGVGRCEPGHQVPYVLPQCLDGQCAGEGELQEDGSLPVLVHGQPVHPLGLAGLAEEGGGVAGVLRLEEEARHLLVIGRQEVGHGPAEPGAECVEALLGRSGPGPGLPAQPLDVLDQGQGVVPVGRVVDQRPGREAQCLAAHLAHDGGLGRPGQPEELQGQVLGFAEGAGHEPDHGAVAQGGVRVGAGGQRVGVVPVGGGGREDRARVQQGRGAGRFGAGGSGLAPVLGGQERCARCRRVRVGVRRRGAHAARSSSATSRPA